jgi:hypothetical protein
MDGEADDEIDCCCGAPKSNGDDCGEAEEGAGTLMSKSSRPADDDEEVETGAPNGSSSKFKEDIIGCDVRDR